MRIRHILLAAMILFVAIDAALPARTQPGDAQHRMGEVPFWTPTERDERFPIMDQLFPNRPVAAGRQARALPRGRSLVGAVGGERKVAAAMERLHLVGLLVLVDGRVALERYAGGHSARERWASFSVAKSISSTLVGAAIRDGMIGSLDDPVTRYINELERSAYDGVTIRQLLTMTSGVGWDEDYRDPASDVIRLFADPPPERGDPTVAYMRRLPRVAPPGTLWHYSTGDAELVGVLLRRATGMPLSVYLSEKIWRPYGMGRSAAWEVDTAGREYGSCCFLVTLRDLARFGQFMLAGGKIGSKAVLPAGWAEEATRNARVGGQDTGYGLHWWTQTNGSYSAIGIFGQMIHIDPRRRLVIAATGNWPRATDEHFSAMRADLLCEIKRAVDVSRRAGSSPGMQRPQASADRSLALSN